MHHDRTKQILKKFQNASVIPIAHYKDIFCRKKQDASLQNQIPMLILAKKRDSFLYPGSPVCQSFHEQHFYYTSCAMNCLYDCEYCYLKGMYPSGNLVIFVNLEDTFLEIETMLKSHPMYLCISYDTDLMALESVTGFIKEWHHFAKEHPQLKIECRTKCARTDLWQDFAPMDNFIFAFTLSPQKVIELYEHKTPPLADRIHSARLAMDAGVPTRLCFDPMIYLPNWKEEYDAMLRQVMAEIDFSQLRDVSVGSFRIPKDYLKNLRKRYKDLAVVWFPFENEKGVCHYPQPLMNEMEQHLMRRLGESLSQDKIFQWKES